MKRQALALAKPMPEVARALTRQGYTEPNRDIEPGAAPGVPAQSPPTSTHVVGREGTAETVRQPVSQLVRAAPCSDGPVVSPRIDMPLSLVLVAPYGVVPGVSPRDGAPIQEPAGVGRALWRRAGRFAKDRHAGGEAVCPRVERTLAVDGSQ